MGALWGVGERTEEALQRLGLRTVADIAHTPLDTLVRGLGDATGEQLHELAWGRDPRPVEREQREKSIGSDETFDYDIDDAAEIHRRLLTLSERTAARMRAAGMTGRTVTLKVRFGDFTTITRSRTLREPTDGGRNIHAAAVGLFDALGLQRARIRLVGVRLERLVEAAQCAHPGGSASPNTAGGRPTGPSTGRAPASGPGRCDPPALPHRT